MPAWRTRIVGGAVSPSFRRLWLGQSVSLMGSQVAQLGVPLVAVVRLHASVASLGVLALLRYLPFLLLSLPAGALLDRWPARPVLVTINLARALLVGAIPVLAASGALRMVDLYALSVAFRAAIPAIVPPERLEGAQARLAGSETVARVAGPGVAGALVSVASAPVA